MNLKDELHDLRLVGLRDYLYLGYGQRIENWWVQQEKARAERKERRLMKTSTWDALAENMGLEFMDEDERDPHGWSQSDYESVMADTIVVERRRWIERAQWIVGLLIALGLGWVGGWYAQPQYAPDPIECTVKVLGLGKEVSEVKCEGVPE